MSFDWTTVETNDIVRAEHIEELVEGINLFADDLGIDEYNWSSVITPMYGKIVKKEHLQELRDAVDFMDGENYCQSHDSVYYNNHDDGNNTDHQGGVHITHLYNENSSHDNGDDSSYLSSYDRSNYSDHDSGYDGTDNSYHRSSDNESHRSTEHVDHNGANEDTYCSSDDGTHDSENFSSHDNNDNTSHDSGFHQTYNTSENSNDNTVYVENYKHGRLFDFKDYKSRVRERDPMSGEILNQSEAFASNNTLMFLTGDSGALFTASSDGQVLYKLDSGLNVVEQKSIFDMEFEDNSVSFHSNVEILSAATAYGGWLYVALKGYTNGYFIRIARFRQRDFSFRGYTDLTDAFDGKEATSQSMAIDSSYIYFSSYRILYVFNKSDLSLKTKVDLSTSGMDIVYTNKIAIDSSYIYLGGPKRISKSSLSNYEYHPDANIRVGFFTMNSKYIFVTNRDDLWIYKRDTLEEVTKWNWRTSSSSLDSILYNDDGYEWLCANKERHMINNNLEREYFSGYISFHGDVLEGIGQHPYHVNQYGGSERNF